MSMEPTKVKGEILGKPRSPRSFCLVKLGSFIVFLETHCASLHTGVFFYWKVRVVRKLRDLFEIGAS